MPQYLIEREIPGAGALPEDELKKISKHSNAVIDGMKSEGSEIEWVQSYAAGDKIYCVYNATNEELIHEHARRGGFPANKVTPVGGMLSPAKGL
jgi:hypothetical protein